jgi:carbonic anhydrase
MHRLKLQIVLLLLLAPIHGGHPALAADHGSASPSVSPAEARARLEAGNQRFVSGHSQHPHSNAVWRAELSGAQHPFATILGCSDSRVPLEPLFDQGFGDLFVIRVAGNVASLDELGSIEYAANHLGVKFVLVLGHEACGAVTAALGSEADREHEASDIQALLAQIEPALANMPAGLEPAEKVHRGVEANVRQSVRVLRQSPALADRVKRGEIVIAGAVYELDTCRVRWLAD